MNRRNGSASREGGQSRRIHEMTQSDHLESFVKDSEERDQVTQCATEWAINIDHLHQVAQFSPVSFQQCAFCKVKPFHLGGFKECKKLDHPLEPQKRRDLIAAARAKLNPPPEKSRAVHEVSTEEIFTAEDIHPDFHADFQ